MENFVSIALLLIVKVAERPMPLPEASSFASHTSDDRPPPVTASTSLPNRHISKASSDALGKTVDWDMVVRGHIPLGAEQAPPRAQGQDRDRGEGSPRPGGS